MLGFLKDFFSFSRKDVQGIYLLSGLLIILLLVRIYVGLPALNTPLEVNDLEQNILILENAQRIAKENQNIQYDDKKFGTQKSGIDTARRVLSPFLFDPNEMKEQEWLQLGLSQKQVDVILNYVNKGGRFYKKEDLRKIYSISASEYDILEPFIKIEEKETLTFHQQPLSSRDKSDRKTEILVEINSADSVTLLTVKGIGPVFARRIIKYRDKLGGFTSIDQLREVYGIDSLKYETVKNAFLIESGSLKRLNVNTLSVEELSTHPYIDFYLAKSIVDYRIKTGRIHSLDELSNITMMFEAKYQKIVPYLEIN